MKAFKLIRNYPHTNLIDVVITGATFDDGTTVVQFLVPKKSLSIFRSFREFKTAYKRLFEKEQRTELVELEI